MKFLPLIIAGLMTVGMTPLALADQPIVSHDDSFSKEGLFKANAADLKDTALILNPAVPLDPTKNTLWCSTFQLAWNKAIYLVGEKLHFENQPPVVDLLNRESFTGADLDPASYVAIADFERNHVEDEIRAALEKTFHGAASPGLIPSKPRNSGPNGFVTYAYLYKNLSFAQPFENNPPMLFGKTKVKNFGFTSTFQRLPDDLTDQVRVYSYKSADDFIIELKSKSPNDQLILAKVSPASTLQETITNVLKRTNARKHTDGINPYDTLEVPKLNLNLRRDFSELEGLVLKPSSKAKIQFPANPIVITKAEQLVRFQLDEKGAILKSEAEMTLSDMSSPGPSKTMRFDKPFLILMKQANADKPYFALWVGNPSLLVPAN